MIPIAPALQLLAQQAGSQVSIANGADAVCSGGNDVAHTVFTPKLAWHDQAAEFIRDANRSLSDPA